jgi:hypothetical protein
MGKGSSLFFIVVVLFIVAFYWERSIYIPKQIQSDTIVLNRQKDNLRIDTILKRYDSLIYRTKVKTNEKIIFIYMWPDSVLIDSIRTRLQQFDSLGNAKNTQYHGTEQKH